MIMSSMKSTRDLHKKKKNMKKIKKTFLPVQKQHTSILLLCLLACVRVLACVRASKCACVCACVLCVCVCLCGVCVTGTKERSKKRWRDVYHINSWYMHNRIVYGCGDTRCTSTKYMRRIFCFIIAWIKAGWLTFQQMMCQTLCFALVEQCPG